MLQVGVSHYACPLIVRSRRSMHRFWYILRSLLGFIAATCIAASDGRLPLPISQRATACTLPLDATWPCRGCAPACHRLFAGKQFFHFVTRTAFFATTQTSVRASNQSRPATDSISARLRVQLALVQPHRHRGGVGVEHAGAGVGQRGRLGGVTLGAPACCPLRARLRVVVSGTLKLPVSGGALAPPRLD